MARFFFVLRVGGRERLGKKKEKQEKMRVRERERDLKSTVMDYLF